MAATESIAFPGSSDLGNNNTGQLQRSAAHEAVLHGKDDLRYEKSPDLGELQAGRVRIHIKANGICGSDVHMVKAVSLETTEHPFLAQLAVDTFWTTYFLPSRLRSGFGKLPDH